MVSDARYRTKVYLDTYIQQVNMHDDNSDHLGFAVMYAYPDYPLELELKAPSAVDVIFAIDEPESTGILDAVTQAAYAYEESVPIHIVSIDKTGVTATKAIWEAEAELRRVCETYPSGSNRSLERRVGSTKRLGSTTLYSTTFILNYRRDTT